MKRRNTVEIDEDMVTAAGQVLGAAGASATVQRALEEIVAREARHRLVERLRAMEGLDLDKPEVMDRAWR